VIALVLMLALSSPDIPCWKVKDAVAMLGEAGAEKEALARGYSKEQIEAARRKCLK
jgi:hypothetical protein